MKKEGHSNHKSRERRVNKNESCLYDCGETENITPETTYMYYMILFLCFLQILNTQART